MRIAILDNVHPLIQDRFQKEGWEVDLYHDSNRDELKKIISKYEGIVLRSRIKMDEDFLQHATRLRFVGRPGAGLENVDLDYCNAKGIQVFRSPEGNRDAVAEHAIGMLLSLFNNLKRADLQVRKGIWIREGNRGHELMGKTVGIIGYGFMGKAFAKRLAGFGVNVLAYDKYVSGFSNEFVKEVSLEELKEEADIVSLHIPQTDETIGMVNQSFLDDFLKPIYLINTARGSSVIIKDLTAALASGKVQGACLDVLEIESATFESVSNDFPSEYKELMSSEKVILSPHIAGWTFQAKLKMAEYLSDKIISAFTQ